MNFKINLPSSSRRTSPERTPQEAPHGDAALQGKAPRRTGSFGRGLGSALATGMTRATEAIGSVGSKKPSSPVPSTPGTPSATLGGREFPFNSTSSGNGASAGGTGSTTPALQGTPDPSHLSNYSLKLSELVNQSLAPTVPGAQSTAGGSSVVSAAMHAPGRGSIPKLDQIMYDGRKLPSKAKFQAIAQLLVTELRYAASVDAYLLRAVSRASLKALTLFASRIDALLVPATKEPGLFTMPSTAKDGIHLSSALEYNIGLATLTWIVEDALEDCIEGDARNNLPGMPGFVSEILTPVRKRMETTILHVVQPVLASVKTSLTGCLAKSLRSPFASLGSPALTPSISLESPLLPPSPDNLTQNAPANTKAASEPTPSVAPATNWVKELQGRLDGCRKLLVPRIEARTSQDGEGWFISVAVHLIWKGLFFLSARSVEPGSTVAFVRALGGAAALGSPSTTNQPTLLDSAKRTPSPGQLSAALKSVANVGTGRLRRQEGSSTPSTAPAGSGGVGMSSGKATPGDSRHDGALSPTGFVSSKNAQPQCLNGKASSGQISDLNAFQKACLRFCKGFVTDKAMAAVAAELSRAESAEEELDGDAQDIEDEEDELARQALAEGLEATNSTLLVIQALDTSLQGVKFALYRVAQQADKSEPFASSSIPSSRQLDAAHLRALKAIPPLLLLHLVFCRLPTTLKVPHSRGAACLSAPPALFKMSWQEYERSIAGFVGGASWAQAAIGRWKKEVEELWAECEEMRVDITFRQSSERGARQESQDRHHTPQDLPNVDCDDLGTTPTPARLAATLASSKQAGAETADEMSEERPRSASSSSAKSATRALNPSFDEARRSTSTSPAATPETSPRLRASSGLTDENMEGSIGSLSLGSAASTEGFSKRPSRGERDGESAPKQRFWKSSASSAGTPNLGSQPVPTAGPARGFQLSSLGRSTFSRTSSPAGSLRLGSRSRSSRRLATEHSESVNGSAGASSQDQMSVSGDDGVDSTALELLDLECTKECLLFFAKVLEWAAWCAGMDLKCQLGESRPEQEA